MITRTADFRYSILRNVSWQDSSIYGDTNFGGADLSYINFTNTTIFVLSDRGFRNVNLSYAVMVNAVLTNQDFSNSNFTNANLTNAILTGVNLTTADFTGANLSGAQLTDVDLTDAEITNADLTNVIWQNTMCPDGTNSDSNGGFC